MSKATVYLNNLLLTLSTTVQMDYLKNVELVITTLTGVNTTVSLSSSVLGQPKVSVAITDAGNINGLTAQALISGVQISTIVFFAKQGILLSTKDVTVSLSGTLTT